MARFRGTIQGKAGMASRLGDKNSGLNVTAQSYNGDIIVDMAPGFGKRADEDMVNICARVHAGTSPVGDKDGKVTWLGVSLYQGPVHALLAASAPTTLIQHQLKTMTIEEKIELYHELGRALLAHPNSYAALEV